MRREAVHGSERLRLSVAGIEYSESEATRGGIAARDPAWTPMSRHRFIQPLKQITEILVRPMNSLETWIIHNGNGALGETGGSALRPQLEQLQLRTRVSPPSPNALRCVTFPSSAPTLETVTAQQALT